MPVSKGLAAQYLKVIICVCLSVLPFKVLGGVQVVPALSHDGNVTLEWGPSTCDSNTRVTTNIARQVGTQTVSVATLPDGQYEYKLTNLANGSYQYNVSHCWYTSSNGFCSPSTPLTFNVNRSAPPAAVADFAARTSSSDTHAVDLSWRYSLYQPFVDRRSTKIHFSRNGDSKRYLAYDNGSCGTNHTTTVADLVPGNYRFYLEICGRTTKTSTSVTCSTTKTADISVAGQNLDVGDSPKPVPSHQNIIRLPFQNSDSSTTITATTAGALSVDNGTATYTIPLKLPPAAAALMPGLVLQYNSNKGNVNDDIATAGFGWSITGFSSIAGCESGHLKPCQRKLADKETFIRTAALYNKWFQPDWVTRQTDSNGTRYWYGENGVGQGAGGKQVSKVEDVYGNRASIHYRPDGRVGFIHFSSQDAVIFEYTNGHVHAITTYINSSLENPSGGQVVSRYEITHGQSTVTDNQLVRSVRECGFDDYGNKSCAKPVTFNWSKGQLGFESTAYSNTIQCPAGTQSIFVIGDLDEDGYGDNYRSGAIYWGSGKQGCGSIQTRNGALTSSSTPALLRTKDGKYLLSYMKLYRPSKTDGASLVATLFDALPFLEAGRVGSELPAVTTIVDDFNADGLDDVYYGGAYWRQNATSPPTFTWDGKQPRYDRDAPSVPNMTYEVSDYTGERKVGVGHLKPRDVNGDGKIDFFNEYSNFSSGIDSFDYNKDGRTDAFFIKDGDFVFDLNVKSGNEFVRAGRPFSAFNGIASEWAKDKNASIDISSGKHHLFPGDLNGDGVPDALLGNGVFAGLRGKPDLLEKVTDGFGAQTTITYDTLHGDLVDGKIFYSPASVRPQWPYEHVHRGMDVVKKVGQSNGVGGFTYEQYYYQGGLYNVAKREFMAFEKITRVLPDHGLVETTYYDHKIPFNGTIVKTESKTSDGKWISRITNHYVTHLENTRFIFNDYSISEDFKLQSTPVSVTKVINNLDRYGALLTSESVTGSGLSGTTVTGIEQRIFTEHVPEHDTSLWLLGFIKQTTTTTERGDGTDRRSHTHSYERESGTTDVRQSTLYVGTDVEVTTTYIRDQRSGANKGVVTETRTSARDTTSPASTERSVSLASFENGIYATTAYNALGHQTSMGYDKRFGKANYTRDANGLESTTTYDPLGRSITTVLPGGVVTSIESYFCSGSPYSCPTNGSYVSLTRTTHPNGSGNLGSPLTVKFYDSLQRVIRTQTQSMSGTWVKQDYHFDQLGRLEQVSEPYTGTPSVYTSYANYNPLGQALLVVGPDGSTTETAYSFSNSLYVTTLTQTLVGTQSSNRVQTHISRTNALGLTHEVTDSGGMPMRYFYNSRGELTGTRVNNNESTRVSMDYDIAGNKILLQDPAAGRIDYVYNGFGELRRQIWQRNTSSEKSMRFDYDGLGRQLKRVDTLANGSSATNSWRYDVDFRGTLYSETAGNGWTKVYSYDSLTRLKSASESYGDGAKVTSFTYDNFNRPDTVTYPNGSVIKQRYTSQGIHYQTSDVTNGQNKLLWELYNTIDSRGNYRYVKFGNTVVTRKTFDPLTGRLQAITSGKVASGVTAVTGTLQQLGYQWDSLGNLQHRTSQRVNSSGSQIENFSERFSYDTLNRLQYAETSGTSIIPRVRDYEYDAYGNMTHNGIGSQQYSQTNGASIYGVTRANNKDYRYDSYGNVTSRGTTNVEYNVFNKPTRIGDTQFWYDANHQKVKQQTGTKVTFFYAGGASEVENNNGTLTATLRVGNYVQKKTGTTVTEEYHLYDHLGSTDVITDANGNAVSRMAFDALGKRLQDTFASANSTANGSSTYKGYTGHDMLDHLGLIHMGGRVYDPDAGRFLSADLFVQAPGNSQSYNRYSYVLNNPLSLVDPTGYRGRSTEDRAKKSDPIQEEVVVNGAKAAEEAKKYAQRWAENFAFRNIQAAIHLGGGYVLYSPALAARLDRLDRHARNGITGAARQAAKIRQQISNSTKKNGAGLGLGVQEGPRVVDSTSEALDHYFDGNGEAVELGPNTKDALRNHPLVQRQSEALRTGSAKHLNSNLSVEMRGDVYHVGKTRVDFSTACQSGSCTTTYVGFPNDGFWDPIAPTGFGDGIGGSWELYGGTGYHYNTYTWSETYKDNF